MFPTVAHSRRGGRFAGPVLVLAFLVSAAVPVAADLPAATDLRVDQRSAPLGVDPDDVVLSWHMTDKDRGAAQSAYRVLVASSTANLTADLGDLWDSGKVAGTVPRTAYAGTLLASDTRYHWKVKLWDEGDAEGPWSPAESFTTGIAPADWTASFVWDGTFNSNDFCYLRREFVLVGAVDQARVHVTAHDDYLLFVNGVEVGRGPAQADPYAGTLYNTYDVTSLLAPGTNVLAARGHYRGAFSGCGVGAEPAFLCELRVTHVGGAQTTVATDSSWRVLASTPYDETTPFRGPAFAKATAVERFDARLEPAGWRDVGFDDSSWDEATVVTPGFVLAPQRVPRTATLEILEPVVLNEPVPGVWFADFGENRAGWPILTIDGANAGDLVTVYYSEEAVGGRIVRDRDRITDYRDEYLCAGVPGEVFEPDVRYNGYRYVEIEGLPGAPSSSDVLLRAVSDDLELLGTFKSSNPHLAAVYDLCVRTQENCTQGVLVDCPQREQSQYTADGMVQGLNLLTRYGDANHFAKMLRDLADSDLGGGWLRSRHPTDSTKVIPEWALFWVQGLWLHRLYTGQEELVAGYYPLVKNVVLNVDAWRNPSTDLIEGVPGVAYSWGELDLTGAALTPLNCIQHGALLTAADMADLLGFALDAADFRARAATLRDGINTYLFDGVRRYRDSLGSNEYHCTSSTFAFAFGVVPAGFEQPVLRYLASFPVGPATPMAAFYYFEVLDEHDQEAKLHDLLNRTDGLWGEMLASGATTAWELYGDLASLCHAWNAFPMRFLASGVVGIEPTSPGFATFEVRPHLGDLETADAIVPTPYGEILARWQRREGHVRLDVRVPEGTAARVHLPIARLLEIDVYEGLTQIVDAGTYVGGATGVSEGPVDAHYMAFDLASGFYHFTLKAMEVRTPSSLGPPPKGGRRR